MSLQNKFFNLSLNTFLTSLLFSMAALLAGCGSGGGNPEGKTGVLAPDSISITPSTSVVVSKGQATLFTATATYADQSTADITSQVTWASSNNSIATIDKNGLASGIDLGNATISAAAFGKSSPNVEVQVTSAVLTVITLSAPALTTAKGVPVTFTATGTFSDSSAGNVSGTVIWSSSNPAVAKIGNNNGIASTLAVGTTSITATKLVGANTVTASATLTVTAATVASIAINPTAATVSNGLSTNFTALGTYTDGSKAEITSQVNWATGNSAIATINNAGVAKGLTTGSSTTVTATLGSIVSPAASLTVSAGIIVGVTITPATQSTPKGVPVTYTAMASYSDNGTPANISGAVAWASSNPTIATMNGSGIASTFAQGSTVISASILVGANLLTSNNAYLTVNPAVLASLAIAPSAANVAAGNTQQFTASGTLTDGSPAVPADWGALTWTSGDTSIATISSSGLATTLKSGVTGIYASTAGGINSNNVILTVRPAKPVIAGYSYQPDTLTISWSPVIGASSYNVYRDFFPGNTTLNNVSINETSAGAYCPYPLTWYVRVSAVNMYGETFSDEFVFQPPEPAPG